MPRQTDNTGQTLIFYTGECPIYIQEDNAIAAVKRKRTAAQKASLTEFIIPHALKIDFQKAFGDDEIDAGRAPLIIPLGEQRWKRGVNDTIIVSRFVASEEMIPLLFIPQMASYVDEEIADVLISLSGLFSVASPDTAKAIIVKNEKDLIKWESDREDRLRGEHKEIRNLMAEAQPTPGFDINYVMDAQGTMRHASNGEIVQFDANGQIIPPGLSQAAMQPQGDGSPFPQPGAVPVEMHPQSQPIPQTAQPQSPPQPVQPVQQQGQVPPPPPPPPGANK